MLCSGKGTFLKHCSYLNVWMVYVLLCVLWIWYVVCLVWDLFVINVVMICWCVLISYDLWINIWNACWYVKSCHPRYLACVTLFSLCGVAFVAYHVSSYFFMKMFILMPFTMHVCCAYCIYVIMLFLDRDPFTLIRGSGFAPHPNRECALQEWKRLLRCSSLAVRLDVIGGFLYPVISVES